MTDTEKAIQKVKELLKKFFDTADVDTLVTIRQAIRALQEKAEREKLQEQCACISINKACCTCVSMLCFTCISQNNYTRGSFCSACGRKLTSAPTDEH